MQKLMHVVGSLFYIAANLNLFPNVVQQRNQSAMAKRYMMFVAKAVRFLSVKEL